MPARIVFANGSKAMAHNLDDLYQRWQMRREELVHEAPETEEKQALDAFVPPLTPLETGDEAVLLKAELTAKLAFVEEKMQAFDMRSDAKTGYALKYERAPLMGAKKRIQWQLGQLNAFQKAYNVQNNTPKPKREYVKTPQRRIHELKQKQADEGLTVEEEQEIAILRFEIGERTRDGMEKQLQNGDTDQRIAKMEEVINELRKHLHGVQEKLINAYERIIELQSDEPF